MPYKLRRPWSGLVWSGLVRSGRNDVVPEEREMPPLWKSWIVSRSGLKVCMLDELLASKAYLATELRGGTLSVVALVFHSKTARFCQQSDVTFMQPC